MRNIIIISFVFYTLFVRGFFAVHAEDHIVSSSGATIREMGENIEKLKQEEKLLQFKWKSFKIGENTLGSLVRQDLNEEEKETIEELVSGFDSLDQEISYDIENALAHKDESKVSELESKRLSSKIDFYGKLTPYISKEKLLEYKNYIESDMNLNEKSKSVSIEIQEQQNIQHEKIEYYQEKIQDNREKLRRQIEQKVKQLVHTRLDAFISNESFAGLENETKVKIFEKLYSKFDVKITELQSQEFSTTLSEEKIIIYEVIQDILYDYIKSWK